MSFSVLVVEDDPVFRTAFVDAIAQAPDMRLAGSAASRAQGLALLARTADVLLVDLALPDGSGIDVIREAAATQPGCEVIVVTIFGDEQHVFDAIAAGATGYLLKDQPPAEIVEQIRVLRAGGSPISPVIARRLLARFAAEAAPAPPASAAPLSEREIHVLQLAAKGYSYDEIAALMHVSPHTVQTYVKRAYRKLQVHTKVEALAEARRLRLLGG